ETTRKGIAGISKEVSDSNTQTKGLGASLKAWGAEHEQSFRAVGTVIGVTAGAVAGLAAGVVSLGLRGAAVGDVRDQFAELATAAGGTDSVLGALRKGVIGTINDFDLMNLANKALGSGLLKSADDAGTLAEGARL